MDGTQGAWLSISLPPQMSHLMQGFLHCLNLTPTQGSESLLPRDPAQK